MNDRRENELIFKALLNESSHDLSQDEWNAAQGSDLDPMAAPFYDKEASEGEEHKQVGDDNETEKAKKADMARSQIREILTSVPVADQLTIWDAVLQDTNLAGRILERWNHGLANRMLQALKDHGESDWLSNVIPARKPKPDPRAVGSLGDAAMLAAQDAVNKDPSLGDRL